MGEPVRVEFYYAIGSRYSYLASTQIAGIEAEFGCRFEWYPLHGVELMRAAGYRPFAGAAPSGQYDFAWRRYDAECWAEYYGVPYREPEDPTKDGGEWALACTVARQLGAVVPYSHALFRARFVEGGSPDRDAMVAAAPRCGLDASRFAALFDDPATAVLHAESIAQAKARGAFGVPSFFVNGRLFWGNDRLPLVRHAIQRTENRG